MLAYGIRGSSDEGRVLTCAGGVVRLATGIVNTYLVGTAERWILVDTGIAGFGRHIINAAAARFGPGSPPAAIVLTHGHFDHAGNADMLARHWSVPVYAHPLELPYLNGKSDYPPQDPTVGGAMAFLSRTFPNSGRTLSADLRALSDETVPEMPEWRWVHTPGHSAGHISLFRDADCTLIAGDAFVTANVDSWVELVRRTPEVCNPPATFTPDWPAAQSSVEALASYRSQTVAAGHGLPIGGAGVAEAVERFAEAFTPPAHGRYVAAPAQAGMSGVEWVPPPVPDPFPRQAAGAAMVVLGALGLASARRRRR